RRVRERLTGGDAKLRLYHEVFCRLPIRPGTAGGAGEGTGGAGDEAGGAGDGGFLDRIRDRFHG
ncbi:hypothetical protein, partial [Streptomyces sp. NPDC048845]|uniref:hypothetical protein n=1 Tax=Streptomyces sp. NPDC048845 TaxID=3155390 RepID=UPI0034229B0F